MACVSADGTLSPSGKAMLVVLEHAATAEEVAAATRLPLFRVRGGLRELVAAGLAREADGRFEKTSNGPAPGS